jgi:cysteine-rich repeat protein
MNGACSESKGRLPDADDKAPAVEVGSMELNLLTPEGVTISEFSYEVTDDSGETIDEATIDDVLVQPISFFLELPVDSGYRLNITAEGRFEDEVVPCQGDTRFNISEDTVTEVELDVVCTLQGRAVRPTGGATVTANVSVEPGEACSVTRLTVGPLVVYQGAEISVQGRAEPDTSEFEWSTTGDLRGTFDFDAPAENLGTFTCTQGQGEIVLTIVDGECSDQASVPVTCAEPAECGDGVVEMGEECDDENGVSEDGCSAACLAERCGDGIVQRGESCDDGNSRAGDGCGTTCSIELCGNGVLEGAEQCDDANLTSGDGCGEQCQIEACGDGVIQAALGEQCDDGNLTLGDGCSEACLFEDFDGDGVVDVLDECDETSDALVGTDGCSVEQLCACDDSWESEAQYLTCVAKVLDRLFAAELIDADERAELQSQYASDTCGE